MNNYFFDLHNNIVQRQGKICKRCKRSLMNTNVVRVINGAMYCQECGKDESLRSDIRKSINASKKSDNKSLAKARADYDRVRKNK